MGRFHITNEENILYVKRNIVDNMYCSARIERIAVTYPEIQVICEGRVVPSLTVEEIVKINNLKHVWWFILETMD